MSLVSIIIPVYYNEQSLPLLVERLSAVADLCQTHQFEFIFVDDGSGDNSLKVLLDLAQRSKRVRVIRLSRNFGSSAAILAGLSHSRGDCAGFLAADLQDPPETIPEMIRAWEEGAEVVLAVRRDRNGDPWLSRLFSNLFNRLFKTLVFSDFSPQGIGFFLIDRRVVDVLVQCDEKNSHIRALVLWAGFRRAVVLYDRAKRQYGRSRWTFGKKVKYFIDAFASFSYLPIRLSSAVGLVFALLGGLYAMVVITLRLTGGIPIEGWTALMVVVLVASGIQMLMLGIFGEYLWRNLEAARRRPTFIIASLTNFEGD